MQNINVNIVPDSYPQTIRYSQGDVGREFKINVVGFTIPTGATVKIQATKPSGFGFSVAGTVDGNAVSFTTTAIMTDEAGRFPAELEITKDSVVIGTANFIMWGEANPHPEGTTDGQQGTIIPELTLLVERVEAAADKILDMEVVANTLPAGSQATYSYDEDLNKATFGIPQGEAGAGAAGVVADAYSSSKTYKVGDYALHNSNLYRCTTAITTAEAFTAAHWTQIVLANDVSDLKTDLDVIADVYPLDIANKFTFDGYLTTGGAFVSVDPPTTQKTTDYMEMPEGEYSVQYNGDYGDETVTSMRAIAFYDEQKICTRFVMVANLNTFDVLTDEKYVRINVVGFPINYCRVYNREYPNQSVAILTDKAIVKTDTSLTKADMPANAKVVGEKIDSLDDNFIVTEGTILDENNVEWLDGYLKTSDGSFVPSETTLKTTDFIELPQNTVFGFICTCILGQDTNKYPRAICFYNADKSFSRAISGFPNKEVYEIYLTGTEKYIRINLNFETLTMMNLYLAEIGANKKHTVLHNVDVNIKPSNYIYARRPIIAFVLDGDYDLNDDMEAIFDNHDVRVGFAPPYDATFNIIPITTYLDWQIKGHEILVHSSLPVGANGNKTDEEIAQIVKDCYDTFTGYGFNLHGFVALQGNAKPIAVENVKKYFDYGFDSPNHAGSYTGSGAESNMYIADDSPYWMWRYSMQLSTLQQMKDAVDRCLSTNGLLVFYGHAMSTNTDYFTTENLDSLLTYIESKGGVIKTPFEAVKDYYSMRWDDVYGQN